MPSVVDNVTRVLRHYHLEDSVSITRVEDDRVFGWPNGHALLVHMVVNGWLRDIGAVAEFNHGTPVSFREPGGVEPAMQVCLHPDKGPLLYFLEIDLDYAAGTDFKHPVSVLVHAGEVIANAITRGKTNQEKVAAMLDKRFGKES